MAGNYITNVNQLVFPFGKKMSNYLASNITDEEKTLALNQLITDSEQYVDEQLRGRTATPALHIVSQCRQIALEYSRSLILRDNYLFNGAEDEKEKKNLYLEEAQRLLDAISFGASCSVITVNAQNTGNGTLGSIVVDDRFTVTEDWVIQCNSAPSYFSVVGSVSGALTDCYVPDGQYPVQADGDLDYENHRRVSFKIVAGATAFKLYDEFRFSTYAASSLKFIFTTPIEVTYAGAGTPYPTTDYNF